MTEIIAILPPPEERPLITFALFAYNQEKYVREAIEGAFAQTYEPLEIILSDDCSTDQTFDVMQSMASNYVGPHRVIVRRNSFNMGTALHVQSAFADSAGELFVVAAGDDISSAQRTTALFSAWEKAGRVPGVVHSGRVSFLETDNRVTRIYQPKDNSVYKNALNGYIHSQWLPAAAPTCAYTREVFEQFGPLLGGSIIEDLPLMLRAALAGTFIACDEVLVRQRIHDNNSGTGYRFESPVRWNRFILSKAIAFRNMQIDLNQFEGRINSRLRCGIERRILAVLKSTTGLMLSEKTPLSFSQKARLAVRLALAPAVASSFRLRVEFALDFLGFAFHVQLKKRVRAMLPHK